MMELQEFSKVMARLEDFYPKFYDGKDKRRVLESWYPLFKSDDAEEVERAVLMCICTLRFAPTIADIKTQMAENRLEDQPTAMEAFRMISDAVRHSNDRTSAGEEFNKLPVLLRKLVGTPAQLVAWNRVSDEAFQTVIMSAIRESYSTLARREAKYYALPVGLQKTNQWRIEGPAMEALPEPERQLTHEERFEQMDRDAEEYRRKYLTPSQNMTDRVNAFKAPITDAEMLMYEAKQKADEKFRMDRMRA